MRRRKGTSEEREKDVAGDISFWPEAISYVVHARDKRNAYIYAKTAHLRCYLSSLCQLI